MQLRIKLGQLFTKKNFLAFVSTILFIGCAAFVAFRGYKCFDKYLKKPQHSEISFESSKNHPFPSFTLCLSEVDSYNTNLLKECQDFFLRSRTKNSFQCVEEGIKYMQ